MNDSHEPDMPLILASGSPRRQSLLREAGYRFTVMPPRDAAECGTEAGQSPPAAVARLARQKAADVAARIDAGIVLAADTVAECQGRILGKPADKRHARDMLRLLRGQQHRVYTGVCVWRRPDDRVMLDVDVTTLRMQPISDAQLQAYLESGAWEGKAGAFGYQDRLGWIEIESGSESNVVGLPMQKVERMLREIETAGQRYRTLEPEG